MFFGVTFTPEAPVSVDAARARVTRVEPFGALVYILTCIQHSVPCISLCAHAVVAAGRVDTERVVRAGGGGARRPRRAALVHVALAPRAAEPVRARTLLARHAHPTVKAPSRADWRALVAVPGVALPAPARVRAGRVGAHRVRVAAVRLARALVYFYTIELVSPGVPWQALAHVAPHHVDASRVGVTVVAVQTTGTLAFIHILTRKSVALEALIALTSVLGVKVHARRVLVARVPHATVVHPWTELAALARHGELVGDVARQRRARHLGVDTRALHVAVVAHALRALLRSKALPMLV